MEVDSVEVGIRFVGTPKSSDMNELIKEWFQNFSCLDVTFLFKMFIQVERKISIKYFFSSLSFGVLPERHMFHRSSCFPITAYIH